MRRWSSVVQPPTPVIPAKRCTLDMWPMKWAVSGVGGDPGTVHRNGLVVF